MNLTIIVDEDEVFAACEYIKGYTFNNAAVGVKYALLPVICAIFGLSQDRYVHLSRIECLSPQCCLT